MLDIHTSLQRRIGVTTVALTLLLCAAPPARVARADTTAELKTLRLQLEVLRQRDEENRREIEELRRRDQQQRQRLEELSQQIGRLIEAAPASATTAAAPESPAAALERALEQAQAPPQAPVAAGVAAQPPGGAPTALRLLDLSLNTLVAAGTSSANDDELANLQGGAHDPDNRGFSFQQAELSLIGAVDPYLRGEAHIVASLEGLELEEAFITTTALPFGLQVEAGQFFSEFGRINPRHPHAWDWLDQPVINTRLFGGEGLRAPGVRLGWLMPLDWYSELHLGVQNADENELTTSFISAQAAGGRPGVSSNVNGLDDMLWLARWNGSWDLDEATTLVVGLSGLYGPNSTGNDAETWIYGTDVKLRWRPHHNFRGWPFLLWQSEIVARSFEAAPFIAGSTTAAPQFTNDIPADTLHDYGGYSEVLWGFRYAWAAGVRYEYASGDGNSVINGRLGRRRNDPLRADRQRLSPLLVWHPTHFSRLRLQYNYDAADHLADKSNHSVWLGLEVSYGKHPAHQY